jgi:hypothetical protein
MYVEISVVVIEKYQTDFGNGNVVNGENYHRFTGKKKMVEKFLSKWIALPYCSYKIDSVIVHDGGEKQIFLQ